MVGRIFEQKKGAKLPLTPHPLTQAIPEGQDFFLACVISPLRKPCLPAYHCLQAS